MATKPHTARARAWTTALSKYQNLMNQRLSLSKSQVQPAQRDQLELAIAAQEEDLLDLPAPSFHAVIKKLELLWEGQLEGVDSEAEAKRLVLGDLGDLTREAAELFA